MQSPLNNKKHRAKAKKAQFILSITLKLPLSLGKGEKGKGNNKLDNSLDNRNKGNNNNILKIKSMEDGKEKGNTKIVNMADMDINNMADMDKSMDMESMDTMGKSMEDGTNNSDKYILHSFIIYIGDAFNILILR